MQILLINQFYKPDVAATGQFLADLAEALVQKGHTVHVLCSRHAYGGGRRIFPVKEIVNGVSVHRVRATGFGHNSTVGTLIDYLSFYILASWRALLLPKMDVCVSLTTPPFIAVIGLLLRRIKGTRMGLWSMDLYPEVAVAYGVLKKKSHLCRLLELLSRYIYRTSSCIISLGEVMTDRLVEAGALRKKITTVHNWVPGDIVHSSHMPEYPEISTGPDEEIVTLVYSGNLGLGHELQMIVPAISQLNGQAKIRVLFVGNGKAKQALKGLTEDVGLDNIEFRPPAPLCELPNVLAAGDIHLISQKSGTQGLLVPSKIYGVFAAGRPTLFIGPSDCEIARVVSESQAGIVVEPGDIDGLVDAIKKLALEPDLRRAMGRRARQYYEEYFGRDRSVSRIVKTIELIV